MDDRRRTGLILEELKRCRSGEETLDVEEEKVKVVIFALRGDLYAFPGADVKEILPFAGISWVPGAPDFIPGVINNRGDIESVIELNRFLGIPESDRTTATRIAIVAKAGVRSGILLDSVLDVLDVPVHSITPPLATLEASLRDLVAGQLTYRGRTVAMLDVGSLYRRLVANGD
jgi:purine-binding chemotaxis protein CheW